MGLYNFHARFVPFILDGSKTQTVRAPRKRPPSVGEDLHLFMGLRRPGAKRLMVARCTRVEPVWISVTGALQVGSARLTRTEAERFFWRDGFRLDGTTEASPRGSLEMALAFWLDRLPFEGYVLHWRPGTPARGGA